MQKKKVLILSQTDLSIDARPLRQIKWLSEEYDVYSSGKIKSGFEKTFIQLDSKSLFLKLYGLFLMLLGFHKQVVWDMHRRKHLKKLREMSITFDLIIAHGINFLPFAMELKGESKVILDAHEYYPGNYDDKLLFRLFHKKYFTYLCDTYLPKTDLIITVSDGIASQYKSVFNTTSLIIQNREDFFDLLPKDLDSKRIKIIHHGIASRSRNLELMIEMMRYIDQRFELYIQLVCPDSDGSKYLNELKESAINNPRVFFPEPVPFHEIVPFTNNFDIGITLVPPVNINLNYGLGNKFFQFIQARLVLAMGPLIEMKRITEMYDLGVVSSDFSPQSMANKLNDLTDEKIMYYKYQSHKYAFELSSESTKQKFLNGIKSLILS